MTDPARPEFPAWWAAAVAEFDQHLADPLVGCSFGGMALPYWYWLTDPHCTRGHGDRCTVCGTADEVTPLRWWAGQMPTDADHPMIEMWEIGLCPAHAAEVPGVQQRAAAPG